MKILLLCLFPLTVLAKDLYLSDRDEAVIGTEKNLVTILKFENPIIDVFLGDSDSYLSEVNKSAKVMSIKQKVAAAGATNFSVTTEAGLFNFKIPSSRKPTDRIYFVHKRKSNHFFQDSRKIKAVVRENDGYLIHLRGIPLMEYFEEQGVKAEFKDNELSIKGIKDRIIRIIFTDRTYAEVSL